MDELNGEGAMAEEHPEKKKMYCLFCGKSRKEVKQLFGFDSILICDRCIEECQGLMDEQSGKMETHQKFSVYSTECSFCGNERSSDRRFVGGGDASICEQCISLIENLQHEEISNRSSGSEQKFHCSFCGKGRHEVRNIVAGPDGIQLCNECALLALSISKEESKEEPMQPLKYGTGPHCSFCNKGVKKARMMASGSGVYICDRCTYLARCILTLLPHGHLREL